CISIKIGRTIPPPLKRLRIKFLSGTVQLTLQQKVTAITQMSITKKQPHRRCAGVVDLSYQLQIALMIIGGPKFKTMGHFLLCLVLGRGRRRNGDEQRGDEGRDQHGHSVSAFLERHADQAWDGDRVQERRNRRVFSAMET
ncbi:MAG: hypothetical protein AAF488_09240, partial [Planctomycetota bacterium]